jgi:hypothetical protein
MYSLKTLFIVAKIWKQLKCLSADEWTMKMCVYTIKFCSALKKEQHPSTKWMEMEIIMLSEIRHRKNISS